MALHVYLCQKTGGLKKCQAFRKSFVAGHFLIERVKLFSYFYHIDLVVVIERRHFAQNCSNLGLQAQ